MMLAIRKNLANFIAIIVLFVIAAGVSVYILDNQRLRFPFVEEKPFQIKAEFSTAQAVIAGQGQTVRVAGVRIGDIGGVVLENGKGIVRLDIDPEYSNFIHTNATALLRPKTGLKDMFIDLDPGTEETPLVKAGHTIPISATLPDVNPDEIFGVLDRDTRDYLKLLVQGAGKGLEGRGGDLNDVFRRFEPTHRDIARVSSAVATRRKNLRRLIHNLNVLNRELAANDDELATLVDSSATVLRSFAQEERSISSAVRELPSALQQTTSTLGKVQRLGDALGPAARALRPAARKLDPANRAVAPFAREVAPLIEKDIRPFVREARPLVRDLKPSVPRISAATPDLTEAFKHLDHFFNLVAFNPNGREPKEKVDRQEGYLFWAAWLQHMAANVFSSSDAHGVFRPVTLGAPCATIRQLIDEEDPLADLGGLFAIVEASPVCDT